VIDARNSSLRQASNRQGELLGIPADQTGSGCRGQSDLSLNSPHRWNHTNQLTFHR